MGLIFSPSVATLSHHFARSRYRTLAFGLQPPAPPSPASSSPSC
jgi:hypothetical protein